jgi:glutamine synthetase
MNKSNATRVEFRSPDSACNPYLTFALMLAAGMRGIQGGYELPAPAADDVWTLTERQRRERGITALPGSLDEAISVMEGSALVRETFGDELFDFFLRNKRAEWAEYRRQVTPFEIDRYLPIL